MENIACPDHGFTDIDTLALSGGWDAIDVCRVKGCEWESPIRDATDDEIEDYREAAVGEFWRADAERIAGAY